MTTAQRRIRLGILDAGWSIPEHPTSAEWRALAQRLHELADAANAEHIAEMVSELGESLATLPSKRPPLVSSSPEPGPALQLRDRFVADTEPMLSPESDTRGEVT